MTRKIIAGGLVLGLAAYVFTFALHLLNQPSDLAVAAGYVILLAMLAGIVELARRFRRFRSRS